MPACTKRTIKFKSFFFSFSIPQETRILNNVHSNDDDDVKINVFAIK